MQGTLSEGELPGILRDLYVGRKTGLLHFEQGSARRSVRFFRGLVVHAASDVQQERLGQVLLRHGIVSREMLEQADALVVAEKKRLGAALHELGHLSQESLEYAVADHVREIVHNVIAHPEGSYTFEELDAEQLPNEDISPRISTGDMILEAVRHVEDPDKVREALGNLDRAVVLSNDPLLRFQQIALTPADGYLLSRVDGRLTATELIDLMPVTREETERSLYSLLATGVVELMTWTGKMPAITVRPPAAPAPAAPAQPARRTPEPLPVATSPPAEAARPAAEPAPPFTPSSPPLPTAPPQAENRPAAAQQRPDEADEDFQDLRREIMELHPTLRHRDHFDVLGVPRIAGDAEVKTAYFALARRFHPDNQRDPRFADLRNEIEAIFIRVGAAYEVLRDARSRASYASTLPASRPAFATKPEPPAPGPTPHHASPPALAIPPPDAVSSPEAAERAVEQAAELFKEEKYWDAIQLLDRELANARGRWLTQGRMLLAKCYLKNPNWVKEAEETLRGVVQDRSEHVEAHLLLGKLYKQKGLKSRAIHMFRRIVEIDPGHEEAAAELASFAPEPEPEAPKQGLLKKLFGRK